MNNFTLVRAKRDAKTRIIARSVQIENKLNLVGGFSIFEIVVEKYPTILLECEIPNKKSPFPLHRTEIFTTPLNKLLDNPYSPRIKRSHN